MKRMVKWLASAVIAATFVFPMTACGEHVHRWSEWSRSETEHWRKCLDCSEEQRGTHEDSLCDECAAFSAIAFGFVEGGDGAHADFAREANTWFAEKGKELGFYYEHTTDWGYLTEENLENYDLVIFLNDKPGGAQQREAFQHYMENGGAWIGFHSAAFEMKSMEGNNIWDWYHEEFLGSGEYAKNTWNPTAETLHIETHEHSITKDLPDTFLAAPNEWYGWEHDLRVNPDITVLVTLDESTFPVGDQPDPNKQYEIWQTWDYYPIAWTNNNYKMCYMNWGHNLQSYNSFEKESKTFSSEVQNEFVLNAMFELTK